ncbi:MAG: hypothetical protein IAI49_13975, partial [Candidatus Eremiobacteraeota bacterium]|nr:hypothetical protein [Candidatus Eremiobacteraeota bacterium]
MIERRSPAVEMLTGVDDDIATMLYEQLALEGEVAEHDRGTVIATIVPPRSLWHAISSSHPRLADDLEKMPRAADAVMQVTRATWEFAFRSGRDVRNVEIRDARSVPAIDGRREQLRFTVTASSETGESITKFPPRDPNNMWNFICARNEQLADT